MNLEKSKLYSEELGINLRKGDKELFKWFLASILYGARIPETIARNTYHSFAYYDKLTPRKILKAGWGYLVRYVMSKGGYVRYDEKTSAKLLKICKKLLKEYKGSLRSLHGKAKDSRDLELKLMEFYGVGPVTVNIFLRELRPYWSKADVDVLPIVRKMARRYKVNLDSYVRKSVVFTRVEAGLIRLRKS